MHRNYFKFLYICVLTWSQHPHVSVYYCIHVAIRVGPHSISLSFLFDLKVKIVGSMMKLLSFHKAHFSKIHLDWLQFSFSSPSPITSFDWLLKTFSKVKMSLLPHFPHGLIRSQTKAHRSNIHMCIFIFNYTLFYE